MKLVYSFVLYVLLSNFVHAQSKDIRVHDPSTSYFENGKYYNFSTGNGIQVLSSSNLKDWTIEKSIFEKDDFPKWILELVPNFKGHFWAPDLIKFNDYYYLYYSCSSFGSATSTIGVVRSKSLDSRHPDYKWEDLGMFVKSDKKSDFNAIDPCLFRDNDSKVYLGYGSFHGGIGLCEIDTLSGKLKSEIKKIAGGRESDWEAPYIIKNGSDYFLFANNGLCCKGLNSTYYLVYGKSKNIFGPYLDKTGKDLNFGGASILKRTEGDILGPGHVGLVFNGTNDLISTHYYDAKDEGKPKIIFWKLKFKKGWPVLYNYSNKF